MSGIGQKPYRRHDPATSAQAAAARPDRSVWVSANAGSGKTRVLTNRVARLLLAGADPARILCLTYTKAAAAEMQNRLFKTLGGWSMADDAALDAAIDGLLADDEPPLTAADRDAARRLFARALETPGGLKIQTIHAFCESLLSRFPLEAGVTPHFQVIDEQTQSALLVDAQDQVVRERAADPVLAEAFEAVTRDLHEAGFGDMLAEIASKRRLFDSDPATADEHLAKAIGAQMGVNRAEVIAAWHAGLDHAVWTRLAEALARDGGKFGPGYAHRIQRALRADPETAYREIGAVLLTQTGAPRTRGFPGKQVEDQHAWTLTFIPEAQSTFMDLQGRVRAADRLAASSALARYGRTVVRSYAAAKSASAGVDYDDLIERAVGLLTRSDARDWIRFKLDGGVEHILVDEAQDTSPLQWRAVAALAEDFFSGDSAFEARREDAAPRRSIFAVGDEKQSIYSFQGAEPAELSRMGDAFAAAATAGGQSFERRGLATSFRSTPDILGFVDRVFAPESARAGLVFGDAAVGHTAFRAGQPGRVEVWPLVEARPSGDPPPWDEPVDAPPADDPVRRLVDLVAATVRDWIGVEALPARGRPIRASDILILVRSRGAMSVGLIKRLKQLGVPVAGEDRLALSEQLVVKDLLALARFCLFPEDDLTLATLLRSPFCDVDEGALFDLAHGRRPGQPLWYALSNRRHERPDFDTSHAFLAKLVQQADFLRPYELFALALGPMAARPRLLARLGEESEDPVDELLAQALAFESSGAPTLQAFVEWIDARNTVIKREQTQDRDEVRVMTAHGAKGLEAPVVILPDTTGSPSGGRQSALIDPELPGAPPVWLGPTVSDPPAVRALRDRRAERDAEEHRRLLYVALTRAEDRLLICGAAKKRKRPEGCWYDLCAAAIAAYGEGYETPVRSETDRPLQGWRVVGGGPAAALQQAAPAATSPGPAPEWLRAPPRRETAPTDLSPSRLGGDDPEAHAPGPETQISTFDPERARRRGVAVHALLELLPPVPAADRPAQADRLLARIAAGFAPDDRAVMREEALAVLTAPDLAFVFGPGSRAEVPIGAVVDTLGPGELHGLIDRLIVGAEAVWIVDFKTGIAPSAPPEGYLRQMGAYRAALEPLYPDRTIHAALLWTASATLQPLDPAMLDAALARAAVDLDRRRPAS